MTFEQAFKRIKTKFENVDASKLQDMALQITLSDEDCGGTLYAAVKDGALAVEPYDYKDNDAVLDVTKAALVSILTGKTSIEKEIENGNLTVKGNLEKVASVKDAIIIPKKAPAKKAPAKKAPAKKAPAKKTAAKKETAKPAVKATPAKKAETKPVIAEPAKKAEVKPAKAEPVKKAETKSAPAKTETKTASVKKSK